MSRDTSLTFREAVFASETSEAFLMLLTIDHETLSEPLRFSSDSVDTTSRGETYLAFPFQLTLPVNDSDRIPYVNLTIDNIHRTIVQTIRELTSPPTLTIEIVLGSTPDVVEAIFPEFILRDVSYDKLVIQGNLSIESLEIEPFPAETYNTINFPGLF